MVKKANGKRTIVVLAATLALSASMPLPKEPWWVRFPLPLSKLHGFSG
jgi:hypothetical protein